MVHIEAPLIREQILQLKAGDRVLLSGTVYTARDAAHQRLQAQVQRGEPLPFPLKNQVIYYVGPTPAPPGKPIGSAGPTTSGRMDAYTPLLLAHGIRGMIGKGERSPEVINAIKQFGAVYFAAVGGAGALMARCIREAEVIAYEDLGTEAIRRLRVEQLPLLVAVDSQGGNYYEIGPAQYRKAAGLQSQKNSKIPMEKGGCEE